MTTVPTDRRLIDGGLTVAVATLVAVFADHWPGAEESRAPECPRCGHVYAAAAPECPSLAMARALLARRRLERPKQVPEWIRNALTAGAPRLPRSRVRRFPPAEAAAEPDGLFDAAPFRRTRPTSSATHGGNH